uniref:Uncharacterized protein n=1 Tax=Cercocebus atys TaxID=9531 RepID=A0A2K5N4Q3_CERAT
MPGKHLGGTLWSWKYPWRSLRARRRRGKSAGVTEGSQGTIMTRMRNQKQEKMTLKKDFIDFQMNSLNLVRRKDLPSGSIDEYEKKSKRISSLDSSTHKSSDNKLEETLTQGAFSYFCISEETIKFLKGRGVTYLFPIQVKTFMDRNRKDFLFFFFFFFFKQFLKSCSPKVLVLAPTRELANQVAKDFKDKTRKFSMACFYGGTPYQMDQMLDLGFDEQVEYMIHESYKTDSEDNPQTLLFSATCPQWVYKVVDLVGKMTQKAATTVEHLVIQCHWSQRPAVTGDVLQVYSGSEGRAIIFCENKKNVTEMAMNPHIKQNAQCLHGDIAQSQREITLKDFREDSFKVLVATNVAAHSWHIPEVDLVIQHSPPQEVESYIHRSGCTGICICFHQPRERGQLRYVEQKAAITFKRVGVPSTMDLVKSKSMDIIRFLTSVSYAAGPIEEKGVPVDALATTLAHISGASSFEPRSLIRKYRMSPVPGKNAVSRITSMCLLKGNIGVCFDVSTTESERLQAEWHDSNCILSVPGKLPETEEYYDGNNSNPRQRSDWSSGWSGRSGGSGGRSGGWSGRQSRQGNGRRRSGNRNRSTSEGHKWSFDRVFGS